MSSTFEVPFEVTFDVKSRFEDEDLLFLFLSPTAPRGVAKTGSSLSEKSNARNTSHASAAFLPAMAARSVRPALCLVRTPLVRCEYTARMRR